MENGVVKILLDQNDRVNKFCPIICVFTRLYDRAKTHVIGQICLLDHPDRAEFSLNLRP